MAVGLVEPKHLLPVPGVKLSAASANIYSQQRLDLALLAFDEDATCSAVFTRNAFSAAPVQVARKHIESSHPRFCIINAGNANAGTGERGYKDAEEVCRQLGSIAGIAPDSILPFSTGVIGEYLPMENIAEALPSLYAGLADDEWLECARAIMTTDTVPKACSSVATIEDTIVTVTGIAKGSGMIKPDMATMLAFIATDAPVSTNLLNYMLNEAANRSFNRICVDGDTSTNDAVVLIATGRADIPEVSDSDQESCKLLQEVINEVCENLAKAIVRDGEGASKFLTIQIEEGLDSQECLDVAYTIATSPLVKTAFFASDPNWGRILAAVGRAGVQDMKINSVAIYLNEVCIVENGQRASSYTEESGQRAMNEVEILLRVCLGRGQSKECIWTCDLSHEYVKINAEYRT